MLLIRLQGLKIMPMKSFFLITKKVPENPLEILIMRKTFIKEHTNVKNIQFIPEFLHKSTKTIQITERNS